MKQLLLFILPFLILCLSCTDKKADQSTRVCVADSVVVKTDSIVEKKYTIDPFPTIVSNPDMVLSSDTLPYDSPRSQRLSGSMIRRFFCGVVADSLFQLDTINTSYHLISTKKINEDVVLCQLQTKDQYSTYNYLATYNKSGKLVDAMYIWRMQYFETKDDSTKTSNYTDVRFSDANNFTLSYNYKEYELDRGASHNKPIYTEQDVMEYKISPSGIISLLKHTQHDEGVSRRIDHDSERCEWDLYRQMGILLSLPYSDNTKFERWNALAMKTDGAPSETLCYDVFYFVFMPQPEQTLAWIFQNRKLKDMMLEIAFCDYYTETAQIKAGVDACISKLKTPAMRNYFKQASKHWQEENNL